MATPQPGQVADEALYGYGEALRFLGDRMGEGPCPGDLFLVEATAEAPLEWLVVEAAGPESWKVVAADLCPMAGTTDVVLDVNGWAGPVTLRCGVSATLPDAALRPDLRTGIVPPEVIEAVRHKVGAVRSGELRGTSWEQETDAEIEYQDWCSEVLQPALQALESAWPATASNFMSIPAVSSPAVSKPAVSKPAESSPAVSRPAVSTAAVAPGPDTTVTPAGGRFTGWQMAAAIVVTAGVTYVLGVTGPSHKPPDVPNASPQLNPQLEWFQPATDVRRGTEREILLNPQAEWVTIVLETWDPKHFPSYAVELERSSGAEMLWASSDLQRQGASEIIFTLPATMLSPGPYLLRLSGHQDGKVRRLEEFSFTVKPAE